MHHTSRIRLGCNSMKHIIVGTAGHIDHGKSALVRALTGTDPDRLKEEKARGITIDLGFAHFRNEDANVAFVDVPGHERFVRNMLAGASGIDCVLLVIAADESVMPQTREHFDICRLLDVGSGLIALTKSDLVDAETRELVRLEARELVAGSFLENAPVVPVSAVTGEGLDELRAALGAVARDAAARPVAGVARLPVDRAFTVKGFGTVVTGTQVSGRVTVDSELEVLPAKCRVKVRGLQVHGETRQESLAGQRVAVNLAGIEVAELGRGDTLVETGSLDATRRFDATVVLLPTARPIRHGARVRFHQGTSEVMARVALAGALAESPIPRTYPTALDPGHGAYARLHLERPAALTRGDRFVLRAYSPPVTIGGGTVLDPFPARGRLRSADGLRRLSQLRSASVVTAVQEMVDQTGGRGLARAALVRRAGVAPDEVAAVVEALVAAETTTVVGELLVAPAEVAALRKAVLEAVTRFHEAQPLEAGLPREEARERFGRRTATAIFGYLVEVLVAEGLLVATESLSLASHRIQLSPEEARVRDQIASLYQRHGLKPPERVQVGREVEADAEIVDRMVKLLLRDRTLVKVDKLLFHAEALARLKADVAALRGEGGAPARIDVGTFKQRYGMTRKFTIPLLEYLDKERVTRRVGNARIVLEATKVTKSTKPVS